MNIKLPVLSIHSSYILPISEKEYGVCGLSNFNRNCYDGVRFIDSVGQEWLIKSVDKIGYKNLFQYLIPNSEQRAIKVNFKLEKGHLYSMPELKSEIEKFLVSKRLSGSPFTNKAKEVPEYLSKFTTIPNLISHIGYFDARKPT